MKEYNVVYSGRTWFIELEEDGNTWNFVYDPDEENEFSIWALYDFRRNDINIPIPVLYTLSEEEFFQLQLVLDTGGNDLELLKKIQVYFMDIDDINEQEPFSKIIV